MKSYCYSFFTLVLSMFTFLTVNATHYAGGEISYRCVGGMDYEITLVAYGDCQALVLPNSWNMLASTANCSNSFSTVLPLVDTSSVDIGCSSLTSACFGGSAYGFRVYLYQDTITLPVNCDDWVFSSSSCCRNNALNNLMSPGTQSIYIETKLNSIDAPCNSSPRFQEIPLAFICQGTDYCISNTAYDADGDSLVFSMTELYGGANSPLIYNIPYSVSNPFASSIGHLFDPLTGNHCFNPTLVGGIGVGYRVDEYRGGVWIGSVHRDFVMNTISCTSGSLVVNGNVADSLGNSVTNGEVVLYQYGMNTLSSAAIDTVSVGGTGDYSFTGIPLGQYVVKAYPDSAMYPGLAASYHSNTHYWVYADPIAAVCDDTLTADIVAVHQSNLAGSGYIEGYLGDLGLRSSFGDPWVGQEVFIETWPGRVHVQTVKSDGLGFYRFQNVPNGTYRIIVDHPGNAMTGYYTVTITGASNHVGLDYAGDAIGIHPYISTSVIEVDAIELTISPNPAISGTVLTIHGVANGKHNIALFDLQGRMLHQQSAEVSSGVFNLDLPYLNKGSYMIQIDGSRTVRVMIE